MYLHILEHHFKMEELPEESKKHWFAQVGNVLPVVHGAGHNGSGSCSHDGSHPIPPKSPRTPRTPRTRNPKIPRPSGFSFDNGVLGPGGFRGSVMDLNSSMSPSRKKSRPRLQTGITLDCGMLNPGSGSGASKGNLSKSPTSPARLSPFPGITMEIAGSKSPYGSRVSLVRTPTSPARMTSGKSMEFPRSPRRKLTPGITFDHYSGSRHGSAMDLDYAPSPSPRRLSPFPGVSLEYGTVNSSPRLSRSTSGGQNRLLPTRAPLIRRVSDCGPSMDFESPIKSSAKQSMVRFKIGSTDSRANSICLERQGTINDSMETIIVHHEPPCPKSPRTICRTASPSMARRASIDNGTLSPYYGQSLDHDAIDTIPEEGPETGQDDKALAKRTRFRRSSAIQVNLIPLSKACNQTT